MTAGRSRAPYSGTTSRCTTRCRSAARNSSPAPGRACRCRSSSAPVSWTSSSQRSSRSTAKNKRRRVRLGRLAPPGRPPPGLGDDGLHQGADVLLRHAVAGLQDGEHDLPRHRERGVLGADQPTRDRRPERPAVGERRPPARRAQQPGAAAADQPEPGRGLAQHEHGVRVDLAAGGADELVAPAELVEGAGDRARRQIPGGGEREALRDLREQPVQRAQQGAGGRRHTHLDRLSEPALERREQAGASGRAGSSHPAPDPLVEDPVVGGTPGQLRQRRRQHGHRDLGLLVPPAPRPRRQLPRGDRHLEPVRDRLERRGLGRLHDGAPGEQLGAGRVDPGPLRGLAGEAAAAVQAGVRGREDLLWSCRCGRCGRTAPSPWRRAGPRGPARRGSGRRRRAPAGEVVPAEQLDAPLGDGLGAVPRGERFPGRAGALGEVGLEPPDHCQGLLHGQHDDSLPSPGPVTVPRRAM